MQPSAALNLLTAMNAAPPNAGASAGNAGDEAPADQRFSQLLSDFGAGSDGQASQQFARGQLLPLGVSSALTAQGLDIEMSGAPPLQLEQLVTAEDATTMLERIEVLIQHGSDVMPVAALEKIKQQLQQIQQSGTPQPLSVLVAAGAQETKEPKLALLVASLFRLDKKTMVKADASEEEAPNQAVLAMQTVSAMMFRPHHPEITPGTSAAAQQKKKPREFVETITLVEPMAQHSVATVVMPASEDVAAIPSLQQLASDPLSAASASLDVKPTAALDLPDVALPVVPLAASPAAKNSTAAESIERADAAIGALGAIEGLSAVGDTAGLPHTAGPGHASSAPATKFVDLIPTAGFVNHAPVKEQVHVAITQAASDGLDRITIQLDPVDLGRVEIKMNVTKEGQTQIYFMVDKPETFDSLSRDARTLERSLQEAGIKADTGSMQFNLRQQPQPQLHSGLNDQRQQPQEAANDDDANEQSAVTGISSLAAFTRNYLINVRDGVDISA